MNEEMTDDEVFAMYFDANGQPVRAGVQLSADEAATYREFFPDTTDQAITEESA